MNFTFLVFASLLAIAIVAVLMTSSSRGGGGHPCVGYDRNDFYYYS
jgi:hypothetical protein